jgi:hypothetical protein
MKKKHKYTEICANDNHLKYNIKKKFTPILMAKKKNK